MSVWEALEEAAKDARMMTEYGLGFTKKVNQVRELWRCPDPDCPWVLRTYHGADWTTEAHFIERCVEAHEAAIHGLTS